MKARENPFRTDQILRVRYRLRGETAEGLLERLSTLNYRAAIVGPKGTGKTTLLEDLGVALSAAGFEIKQLRLDTRTPRFPRGFLKRFLAELTERDLILFDGAEQMSRFEWHCFKVRSRKAGGLVVTSHRRRMLPTLTECATSAALLDDILAELIGADAATLRRATVDLHRKHNGNLRDALREMYDSYAEKRAED